MGKGTCVDRWQTPDKIRKPTIILKNEHVDSLRMVAEHLFWCGLWLCWFASFGFMDPTVWDGVRGELTPLQMLVGDRRAFFSKAIWEAGASITPKHFEWHWIQCKKIVFVQNVLNRQIVWVGWWKHTSFSTLFPSTTQNFSDSTLWSNSLKVCYLQMAFLCLEVAKLSCVWLQMNLAAGTRFRALWR